MKNINQRIQKIRWTGSRHTIAADLTQLETNLVRRAAELARRCSNKPRDYLVTTTRPSAKRPRTMTTDRNNSRVRKTPGSAAACRDLEDITEYLLEIRRYLSSLK